MQLSKRLWRVKTEHIKNTGQIGNKGQMRKLPGGGGMANGANCQEGAMKKLPGRVGQRS